MNNKSQYKVHTGDAFHYFGFGHVYKAGYLKTVFKKAIQQCSRCTHPFEVFPGLVLEDSNGVLWKPRLQVELVPVTQEESESDELERVENKPLEHHETLMQDSLIHRRNG
jgi:hypothetical protein